jgi:D-alanine-D-alanine ligase
MMKIAGGALTKTSRSNGQPPPARTVGPVPDLERHLPSDWWRTLFNSLYLKTDGDVVENAQNTGREVDLVIQAALLDPNDRILDLCCGQGRHSLELARRGFRSITGVDRSRYLIRLARKRAQAEKLPVAFHEGDARRLRAKGPPFHGVLILGNSFGYFEQKDDDEALLRNVLKLLTPNGVLVLDIADGEWLRQNFEARSWEWIDQVHFVCRERSLSGEGERIVSREVIVHAERGVIADQFYAERLYTAAQLTALLERAGFQMVRLHGAVEPDSERGQDLGMMAHRLLLTARAPARTQPVVPRSSRRPRKVTVLLGDPTLPDPVKVDGRFNPEDFETVERLQQALSELTEYEFTYLDDHQDLTRALLADPPSLVFNLCDEGYRNDALKELHIPALLEILGVPYTGAGPACLGLCYNKNLIRAIAESMEIPVPMESYLGPDDRTATLPATFPAIVKPNFGDSSVGITKDAVVHEISELLSYIDWVRETQGLCPILVQEFLPGPEYSVSIIGNPGLTYRILPILEVDYSRLDAGLPHILGYESKWNPESPYWKQIQYVEGKPDEDVTRCLHDYSSMLYERLCCRDCARFDYRVDADGNVKLLEVNPNPGWCWDGKLNLMAALDGLRYAEMLRMILEVAQERLAAQTAVAASPVGTATGAWST